MNEDQKIFLKFCMFGSLLGAPLASVAVVYVYFRDLSMGRVPPVNGLIGLEVFFVAGTIYAYWFIKRMGWDFWTKDKPQKNKLSSKEKWWEEKD